MEKKTYIKPELMIEELIVETQMLTGSFVFSDEEVDTESEYGQLSAGRRGKWGDLWYVEEN